LLETPLKIFYAVYSSIPKATYTKSSSKDTKRRPIGAEERRKYERRTF
jgi:hypothetical protein